jgi:hypothetical protein
VINALVQDKVLIQNSYFLFTATLILLSNEFCNLYDDQSATLHISNAIRIMQYWSEYDVQAERLLSILRSFRDVVFHQQISGNHGPSYPLPNFNNFESIINSGGGNDDPIKEIVAEMVASASSNAAVTNAMSVERTVPNPERRQSHSIPRQSSASLASIHPSPVAGIHSNPISMEPSFSPYQPQRPTTNENSRYQPRPQTLHRIHSAGSMSNTEFHSDNETVDFGMLWNYQHSGQPVQGFPSGPGRPLVTTQMPFRGDAGRRSSMAATPVSQSQYRGNDPNLRIDLATGRGDYGRR